MGKQTLITIIHTVLLATAALAGGGCSGGSPATAPGVAPPSVTPASDPSALTGGLCDLLTEQEVGAATAIPAESGTVRVFAGLPACQWALAPGTNGSGFGFDRAVTLVEYVKEGSATTFDALTNGSEPVPGIGERAAWDSGMARAHILQIVAGGRHLQLAVELHDAGAEDTAILATERAAAVVLAAELVGRI